VADNKEATMATGDNQIIRVERRAALAERLWRAAEMQAAEVEARIAAGPRPAADSERDAKTLSVLARTLRELSAAESATLQELDDGQEENAPADDVEGLRQQLYQRLRGLSAKRNGGLQPTAG
jgi:hypothetical protein